MSLTGKVSIVTGAGSGIGRATSLALAHAGAGVVLVGRRSTRLRETSFLLQSGGSEALVVQADVSKPSDARRIVRKTLDKFGRLDILVNNAGIGGPHKKVPQVSEQEWDAVLDVNLKGAFLCSKYAIPAMTKNKRGVITNVASNWGIVGGASYAPYCASKAGMILLTKVMAIDHADEGIVVNCICPGDVYTPMQEKTLQNYSKQVRSHKLAKMITPEEIANAILYLVSDQAAMTTGTIFVIDNGLTASEGSALLSRRTLTR